MTKKNPHWGTTLDTLLSEEGIGTHRQYDGIDAQTV
jgi:hypothetical protein